MIARIILSLTVAFSVGVRAQEKADWQQKLSRHLQADFPYTKAAVRTQFPKNNVANKGMAIIVGREAFMCFDTDLLRWAAGWTGGYITEDGVSFKGNHGASPRIAGEQKFGTSPIAGWADAKGSFADSRPEPFGPLPRKHVQWLGNYVADDQVVLSYRVHGVGILEQPGSIEKDGQTIFVRSIKYENISADLVTMVCEVENAKGGMEDGVAILVAGDQVTQVALMNAPKGSVLEVQENKRVVARLAKGTKSGTLQIHIWRGAKADLAQFAILAKASTKAEFRKEGKNRWPDPVVTQGVMNASKTPDGAYVTDVITSPEKNQWNRRVRFGGLDFFSDGNRAALSTWDGDVWVVSGLKNENLKDLKWTRFASGGFETLGLKIVDDVIYTSGRDQITRYHDLNNDGEADYYESFNNEITSSQGFHEFVFDLHTDKEGNFYTIKAGPVRGGGRGFGGGGGNGHISAHAGSLMKIDKNGKNLTVVATGFRAPNGMGVGPNGQLTSGDNEGSWVPRCPINWIRDGGFYGVETLAHKKPVPKHDKPLCWLDKGWDNSGGGQVWVTSDKWGPFQGELLHTSYGRSSIYLVLKEEVNGQMQGGVVKLPLRFTSSAMRPRFNPSDGHLYVAGLKGWQSNAARITGLDRIRYTGKKVYTVRGLKVNKAGVHLTFTQPLDAKSASDSENYAITRWNYQRTQNYGSPTFKVSNPKERGNEGVKITGATLSADRKTVTLSVVDLQPCDQQLIRFNIEAADGTRIRTEVMHTIHVLK
ncbi:MAG TPA: hypothetical protein EYQ62_01030 [Verrucomicrobiales bacterium]|nr:hypothetical protein [Verrucomicrobiales bacterium]